MTRTLTSRINRAKAAGMAAAILLSCAPTSAQTLPKRQPNIILIVVDDAAFMDFGAYGGEARTPNIDRLAAHGALMTNYHSSPLCSPSRAMLLTGIDSHQTGVSTIEEVLPPEQRGRPGYSLSLEPNVLTIADRLKAGGYRTLMSGKWHLGHGAGDLPNSHGFDRSLALDASGADNWAAKPYMPYYDDAPWFEDGKPTKLPASYYSSELLVDRLISYIDADKGPSPFFGYLAFQAVHIPVQAPRAYSDHYKGVFDGGWEKLREDRWRRAKAAGLIPEGAGFTPLPASMRRWNSLSKDEQRLYARSMEVYAGMLEAMDANIGRLIAHIDARGELDNTLFVITSDNGPEPSDPVHARGMNIWMPLHGYDWKLDTLGEPGSLAFIGPEWAASVSSPSSLFKFYASEGGLRVPLVISGSGVAPGQRPASTAFVTDIAPTLLDLAGVGVAAPARSIPIGGRSLAPVLTGAASQTHGPEEATGFEVSGNSALFRGPFKIVRNMPPVGDGRWRLYDLATDPGEVNDLSTVRPDLHDQLLKDYDAYARRVGVLPLPENYQVERQIMRNAVSRQIGFYGWWIALAGAALLAVFVLLARALLKRRS